MSAQVGVAAARELARSQALEYLGRKPDAFLAIARQDELETTFGRFIHDGPGGPPFIFRLTDVGDEVRGNTVTHRVPTPSVRMHIAVSEAGRVFLLKGRDSLRQMKLLAHAYHVRIENDADARDYAVWCLTIDPENYVQARLGSVEELKEVAQLGFRYSYSTDAERESQFEHWWKAHEEQAANLNYDGSVVRKGSGFVVRFVDLSIVTAKHRYHPPVLLERSLYVSPNGEIGRLQVRKIPWPKSKRVARR